MTTQKFPLGGESQQRTRRQALSGGAPTNRANLTSTVASNRSGIQSGTGKGVSWGSQSAKEEITGVPAGGLYSNSTVSSSVGAEGPINTLNMHHQQQAPQNKSGAIFNIGRPNKKNSNISGTVAAKTTSKMMSNGTTDSANSGNQQKRSIFVLGQSDESLQSYLSGVKNIFCCLFSMGLNNSDRGKSRNQVALENMTLLSKSHVWVFLRVVCAFVMIFGEEIQIAFFPSQWDLFFLILFLIVLALVIADMIVLICTDPTYFLWSCPSWCGYCRSKTSCCCCAKFQLDSTSRPIHKGKKENFQFGSFMFWLDLVSILSFLPSIPYLEFGSWSVLTVVVELGGSGYVQDTEQNVYVNRNLHNAPIVGRAARLARFIRPSTAVKISRSVNILNIIQKVRTWWNRNSRSRTMNWIFHRFCFCFGPVYEKHLQRDDAAVIIQRAWLKFNGYSNLPDKRRSLASFRSMKAIARLSTSSIRRGRSKSKSHEDSQVGAAMRELTAQRIVIFIMLAILLAIILTYRELNTTPIEVMKTLHFQTQFANYSGTALEAARITTLPNMFAYNFSNGSKITWELSQYDFDQLRDSEIMNVTIISRMGDRILSTGASVVIRENVQQEAFISILWGVAIIIFWVLGVTGFAGPIMTLVVTPIERMIRLLGMLTHDPLGYHNTSKFKQFVTEEYEIAKVTAWTTNVLSGMETSFLMSTILRIGSLMRVGFGSAGVEIIRNNLNSGTSRNSLTFDQTGSTVSCIFLFCDIRSFTDCTEALQEEVFVFTNRIAAVVHSICSAYGGSANKNVGDAFLLSWRLDESKGGLSGVTESITSNASFGGITDKLVAKHHQADKALYSVIQICKVLVHDEYFLEEMSQQARERLLGKLCSRKGPVVQIGFGLHAGEAVQGAIGSQRKIDATYLSEVVDHSETLESATKRYGVKVLMSNAFYDLLSQSTRRRCRKVDQILLDEYEEEGLSHWDAVELGETMELYTYDFDVEALFRQRATRANSFAPPMSPGLNRSMHGGRRRTSIKDTNQLFNEKNGVEDFLSKFTKGPSPSRGNILPEDGRRPSWRKSVVSNSAVGASTVDMTAAAVASVSLETVNEIARPMADMDDEVVLPQGPAMYSPVVWINEEMRLMRAKYSDGMFYRQFELGLKSYFSRDWKQAKEYFELISERMDDGPTKYFMSMMEKENWKPPRNFTGYGSP